MDIEEFAKELLKDGPVALNVVDSYTQRAGHALLDSTFVAETNELGKYLPELISTQNSAAEEAAKHLGVNPEYPILTGFDDSLVGSHVQGYTAKLSPEYTGGKDVSITAYNPDIVKNPRLREDVARHEGIHLVQPGKEELLKLKALTLWGTFSIGLALIEGGDEVLDEKIHGKRTGAYEKEYIFAKIFDRDIMPLGDLYKMAEYKGADAVAAFLIRPDVSKKVYRAFLESYEFDAKN